MANTLKFGSGQWATKVGSTLAYNDEGGNFKPLPFNFTRSTSATRVNKDGLIEMVTNNKPRIDFLNDSNGALLLEPSRTNSLLQSNQFDTTWVTNTATIEGGQVGVGNTNDAWLLSRTGTNGRIYQTSTSSGSQTLSVYAKSNTNNWLFLVIGSSETAYYDLENGVVGTTSSSNIAKIEPIGNNGWYRCSLTFTYTNPQVRIYPAFADNNVTGSGSIYIQNAQLEGGSYATSYIPTQGAISTRVAETCIQTPPSGIIGQTEGTLFWDGVAIQGNFNQLMFIKDSSSNQFIGMTVASGIIYGEIFNSSGYVHLYSYSIGANDTRFKMALAYKTNSFAFYINGVQVANSTTGTTPTSFDDFYLNSVNNVRDFNCQINSASIWNTRLTNAELENLTTL